MEAEEIGDDVEFPAHAGMNRQLAYERVDGR